MIDQVKGYGDLRSLNTYLENKINSLDSRQAVPKKIDALIKKIRKNELCFSNDENTTDDYVKFLECYFQIQKLSVNCGQGELKVPIMLKKARRLARKHFTQLSGETYPSIPPIFKQSLYKIERLRHINKAFYFRTLANWIAKQKVAIEKLDLDPQDLNELAPRLTYLKISSTGSRIYQYDDEFIGNILKRTRRLRHLTIKDSTITGEFLPQLQQLDQLESLVLKRCIRLNGTLPAKMYSLQKLKIELCPMFRQALCVGFLASIYFNNSKRAMKFADSLNISLLDILSHRCHEPYIEDVLSEIDGFTYRTIRRLLWGMLVNDGIKGILSYPPTLVKALLSTSAGRDFVEQHVVDFLDNPDLLQFLLAAYPPGKPENLPLYPIKANLVGDVLHLTMIPSMPRDYPDKVFEIVVRTRCKALSIVYYGRAIEGGEKPERRFFADLMQGLIHSSQEFKFKKLVDGKYIPSDRVKYVPSLADNLGTILGLALHSGRPIGNVFSLEFIRNLRLALILVDRVLSPNNKEDALVAAKELNNNWKSDEFSAAIDAGELDQIQGFVRRAPWLLNCHGYDAISIAFAHSLRDHLPFSITKLERWSLTINNMADLNRISPEEFAMQLQGKVPMVKEILVTPACREFVENNISGFLKDPELLPLVLAAYPPDNQENLCFYPIQTKLHNGVLYLTMIPTMPRDYPDAVIDTMMDKPFTRVSIAHYGSHVVDEGGPTNQFYADLMMGLIHNSRKFKFTKKENGKLIPDAKEKHEDLLILGQILALALRVRSPIGDVFCKEFIHCMRTFSRADLKSIQFSPDEFFKSKTHRELIDYMKEAAPPTEWMGLMEGVLASEDDESCLSAAEQLDWIWCDNDLLEIRVTRNTTAIKDFVRAAWLEGYKDYIMAANTIARGIEANLPFKLKRDHSKKRLIEKWEDLAYVTTDELALQLQGKLTVKWIKDHLVFLPTQCQEALNVKEWINRWLDEHKDQEEILANVIQTLTGARALTSNITITLTNSVKGVYVHTCFQTADVPMDIDEEGVRAVLDAYGRGEHHHFNRS